MTKYMRVSFRHHLPIVFILLLAIFVRFYRIGDFTQFRGDQGSAGMVIYEALQKKELPLVGPTVSTGQRPGPAYYYIIALPFILSNFNPLVPSALFALLGVFTTYLLYYLSRRLFGEKPALVVGIFYAVSPPIVAMDRTMWNPTAIPFLVTVVIASLYNVYKNDKPIYLILASFCLGILVQLHYTNILWVLPLGLLWLWNIKSLRWGILTIGAFLLPLTPFLLYQMQHQFIDIRELFSVFLHPSPRGAPGPRFIGRLQYVIERTFFSAFPRLHPMQTIVIGLLLLSAPFVRRKNFFVLTLSTFSLASIGLFSWYKGPFFDHYLWFLLPVPFLLVGSLMEIIIKIASLKIPRNDIGSVFVGLTAVAITLVYVPKLELTKPRIGDIERTQNITDAIVADNKGEPFSFGLISSNSYSDLHYRFYFLIRQKEPLPILDESYKKLYLVCEGSQCPPFPFTKVDAMKEVRVFCYDHVCKGEYPLIDLSKFTFEKEQKISGATVYVYRRN